MAEAPSVVVPTLDRKALLRECLLSLLEQDSPPGEILVVDNGSVDGTAGMLDREFPLVRRVLEPRRGVHHARNRGVREARGRIVCFIDDDCVAPKGWLRALAACFDDASVAAAGGPTRPVWEAPPPRGLLHSRNGLSYLGIVDFGPERRLVGSGREFLIGANLALRKDVAEREGLFRAVFPLPGTGVCAEDFDLFRRLSRRHPVVYEPAAYVHHRILPHKLRWSYLATRVFCIEAANSRLRAPLDARRRFPELLFWEGGMSLAKLLGRGFGWLLPALR
ncbi:MAG: glycosyltransferase [Elusimicrobia bacterium]|nr:glycosyltransferase [Elusimicrobiota bacterium]